MKAFQRRFAMVAVAVTLSAVAMALSPAPASAATGTVVVRGVVTCPEGQSFVGTWINSSGGKAQFADWQRYPGAPHIAKISKTLSSVTLPSKISLNIGCGGKTSGWKYKLNGYGSVTATAYGTAYINVNCSTTSCSTAPQGTGGVTSPNPFLDSKKKPSNFWCTWRAAEYWKRMTGRYPAWGGDAGYWDDSNRAPRFGWATRGAAEPNSLLVWQPGTASKYGHVGFVADTRVSSGVVEVKIFDRNWNGRGGDRDGEWIPVPEKGRFIRVPPQFTPFVY